MAKASKLKKWRSRSRLKEIFWSRKGFTSVPKIIPRKVAAGASISVYIQASNFNRGYRNTLVKEITTNATTFKTYDDLFFSFNVPLKPLSQGPLLQALLQEYWIVLGVQACWAFPDSSWKPKTKTMIRQSPEDRVGLIRLRKKNKVSHTRKEPQSQHKMP